MKRMKRKAWMSCWVRPAFIEILSLSFIQVLTFHPQCGLRMLVFGRVNTDSSTCPHVTESSDILFHSMKFITPYTERKCFCLMYKKSAKAKFWPLSTRFEMEHKDHSTNWVECFFFKHAFSFHLVSCFQDLPSCQDCRRSIWGIFHQLG